MKVWLLQKSGYVEMQDRPEKVTEQMQIKVRISKVLLSEPDRELMLGQDPAAVLPVIPGRSAVGVISEKCDCSIQLEKGMRVYLHPVYACGVCENCKSGMPLQCTDAKVAGCNAHGFLREFAVVSLNDVTILPPSVSEEVALFTEWLAIAENVLDTLQCSKGDHVLVLGANLLGNVISQLLIYRQIVPVLVDHDPEKLAYAKHCGIYYTFLCDETLQENVVRVTGGRLASAAVHASERDIDPSLAFSLSAPRANVVYAGFGQRDLNVNLRTAMARKQRIFCVTEGKKHIASAINLLANKAIALPDLHFDYHGADEIKSVLESLKQAPQDFRNPLVIRML